MSFKSISLLFCVLLLSLSPSSFAAKTKPKKKAAKCDFVLDCSAFDQSFKLRFSSISGSCTENDLEIILEKEGEESKSLKAADAGYVFTEHILNQPEALCKGTGKTAKGFTVYPMGKDKIIIFVKSKAKKGHDNVTALLFDPAKGDIVDTRKLAPTKNTLLAVLPTKTGFKLRLINDELSLAKDYFCGDCDAAFVDAWMDVSLKGSKIQSKWLKN